MTIGNLSAAPAFVGAYLQPSTPLPNFPAAPTVPSISASMSLKTGGLSGTAQQGPSPSPSFIASTPQTQAQVRGAVSHNLKHADSTGSTGSPAGSPPMTSEGLSQLLSATRMALSKSSNLSVMTMEDLELFRQQQMLLQAAAATGQSNGANITATFGQGTISMLADGGGLNHLMADTGTNLPFLLSSSPALALLEQDPVSRSSSSSSRSSSSHSARNTDLCYSQY
jgi:hypothetical protein